MTRNGPMKLCADCGCYVYDGRGLIPRNVCTCEIGEV